VKEQRTATAVHREDTKNCNGDLTAKTAKSATITMHDWVRGTKMPDFDRLGLSISRC
jgi:hypothetical protein